MKILYLPNEYSQQRQREKKACIYPILMAMEAEWYRKQGHEVHWCEVKGETNPFKIQASKNVVSKIIYEPEGLDFLSLPKPDRVFTRAMDKKYQSNGNFKYLPGTYIQSANGCWWGNCTFCVEKNSHYQVRDVNSVIEEIKECKQMGFREVFDDSGTFPTGRWLDEFCDKLRTTGMVFSCNMRLIDMDYRKLRKTGFRMVLFGVEAANQRTLDIINKGVKVEDIKYIIKASKEGIEPHIAVMFGYPWETDKDSIETLRLVHYLLKKGYAKTAQASFYQVEGEETRQDAKKYIKKVYDVAFYPGFWFNKIKDIHNVDDLKYLWRAIKKGLER